MKSCTNRILIIISITLIVMVGTFSMLDTFADDNTTMSRLLGIWWTHDSQEVPWAIQFKDDGTFRSAHSYLRLEKMPVDTGHFQVKGTLLKLISDNDCKGPCKGLKGHYKVKFTKYGELKLIEQKDQCFKRKEVCGRPWVKVLR